MRLRLGAYLTGILFLGVLVLPFFSSHHNPRASHIDLAQGQYQAAHNKKYKMHIQYPGFFSPRLKLASRTCTLTDPVYVTFLTNHAAAIRISCRAPPV